MNFKEVCELIDFMRQHPYIILRKMQTFSTTWFDTLKKIIKDLENNIETEDTDYQSTITTDELGNFIACSYYLPAIMLDETDEDSWKVFNAIILIMQNYGSMFQQIDLQELAETLALLSEAKNSWSALMLQCESLLLQQKSIMNNCNTPYKLSKRFLETMINTGDE